MVKFPVTLQTAEALERRMAALGIKEGDLEERFIKGSGPGGQKINKTSVCVYLRHLPSGIELKCQQTRSQALNRYHARKELCERLEERLEGEKSARRAAQERIRRQKRRRSKRQKEKLVQEKRVRGEIKKARTKVHRPD
jgi:protein subunit release factor B